MININRPFTAKLFYQNFFFVKQTMATKDEEEKRGKQRNSKYVGLINDADLNDMDVFNVILQTILFTPEIFNGLIQNINQIQV